MASDRIPVNEPDVGALEIEYVTRAVTSGWISSAGPYLDEFERRWAAYCQRKQGVAVSNGSTALVVALRCLDLQPGDEVIIPSFTIMSCASAVVECGAIPVAVDVDPFTWTLDPAAAEAAVTPRTRAIMPVHIYGHPADMDAFDALAERHGLAIVEDAAEAHGAEYLSTRGSTPTWRKAGSFGRLSCFSFYANKIVTTGEGGMVLVDDDALAARARSLRNLCFGARRFRHADLGYNFRLTNLQAALGVAQLDRIDDLVARKREQGARYLRLLADVPGVQLPVERDWARNVYWMFGVVLHDDVPMDAEQCSARLLELGVETRPFFWGLHDQVALSSRGLPGRFPCPVTDRLARRGLYLPSGMTLTSEQAERSVAALREVLR